MKGVCGVQSNLPDKMHLGAKVGNLGPYRFIMILPRGGE